MVVRRMGRMIQRTSSHRWWRTAVIASLALLLGLGARLPAAAQQPAGAGGPAPAVAADQPWPRHVIASGPNGADGVHLADLNRDGHQDVATGWEQAGVVTVSLHPGDGDPTEPWPTVTIATHLHGVEDAIFADVDGDGNLDVVTACECRKVVVYFGPDPSELLDPQAWEPMVLPASLGLHRYLKVAVADLDGDQQLDIIGGGKVTPATVGWFRAPADPREAAAWTYTPMSEVGWTMSLIPMDVDQDLDTDVVLSDRVPIRYPDRTIRYDLRGTRWLENTGAGAGWVNHPIGFSKGEHKFLHIADFDGDGLEDVLDGISGPTYNRSFLRRNLGQWGPWEEIEIPQPDGVGRYQDVRIGDIDRDGDLDLVFSYAHAYDELSGVAWLAAGADGGWQRGEISGPAGTKYDNLELYDVDGDEDLDVITSEQVDQLGVIWYENPG